WTPAWLANQLVGNVLKKLPAGTDPQLIDMCCGSGAMIVEAVRRAKLRIQATSELTSAQKIQKLTQAITGFDIDPLAVMLSKITWVLAARDLIDIDGGSTPISIPVYHADSLFAITPLSQSVEDDEQAGSHKLQIA